MIYWLKIWIKSLFCKHKIIPVTMCPDTDSNYYVIYFCQKCKKITKKRIKDPTYNKVWV